MSDFGEKQNFTAFNSVMMCVQHVTGVNGQAAINFDMASHGKGVKPYSDKVTVQLNVDEMMELIVYLKDNAELNTQFGFHGESRNKMLAFSRPEAPTKGINTQVRIVEGGKVLFYMNLNNSHVKRIEVILLKQIANALQISLADAIKLFY